MVSTIVLAQHHSKMTVEVDPVKKTLNVIQELTYFNQSQDSIGSIVLNDWNNAYADKNSYLGKRFSDEFVRNFQLAKEKDRGNTNNITIIDAQNLFLNWIRPESHSDLIEVQLREKIAPNQKATIKLTYVIKIPSDKFTKYGSGDKGEMNLKNWFLTPARFENNDFVRYSNANLDDIANGIFDIDLEIKIPSNFELSSDLNEIKKVKNTPFIEYTLTGKNRNDFSLFIEQKSQFYSYKSNDIEVITDLKENRLDDIQKAIVIDHILNFVADNIGKYPYEKISVSQVDYERNPFYGLNQLPSFISPFSDEFLFELKFLKTYLNNYLKNSLHLDPRKDNWIYDGIQVYIMMKYIEDHHPESKMMGSLSKLKLLKSFNIINLDFNEQYSYYYMLMARKNLDQPLGDSKETLIRFNEKIASKYRAGLSLKYLDNYLEDSIVPKAIKTFFVSNTNQQTSREQFENTLKKSTNKDINWFFETIINSRDIIDYKFDNVTRTKDSITFSIKNRTGTTVPISVYGMKGKSIVFKKWFENIKNENTFTVERKNADKIVLNYKNEVPEFNLRNNWKSLNGFAISNRPFKFAFMKDLEDPYYNQILYVPTIEYNLYNGLSPGIRFHNKTILDKPFVFDVNPMYAPLTRSLTGNFSFGIIQYNRDKRLFNTRYGMSGSYFNYAPDATYLKIIPSVYLGIRQPNFRDNRKQGVSLKYNMIQKENSRIVVDSTSNYNIFSARYFNSKMEISNFVNFNTDLQLSGNFGKASAEMQYRKLLNSNRQINLRLYVGSFIYSKNLKSRTYNFGVSKPNDYLFEYNLLGRSETTGLFSQQYFMAEGGFKSILKPSSVNQWMTTFNTSYTVWNWIEIYSDLGFVKNRNNNPKFIYDSGLRLNFVQDYLELYLPIYSNNGWEIAQPQYNDKIRFIFTFSPKSLINLFTRKWF